MASRYWDVNFSEYFSKDFNIVIQIKPGGWCPKLKILKETIWVPVTNGNLDVYSEEGNIRKTIVIKSPISVEQAGNGDIFIACHSNSGLYIIDKNDVPQKICNGSFADVYAHRDKVYALECMKKIIMIFCCGPDVDDVKQRWSSENELKLDEALFHDKLIVTGDVDFKLFVSHCGSHRISQYNTQGQCVKYFGSRMETGDGNLNHPFLCGVDRQSHLLVADGINKVYKILDPGTGKWRSTGVRGESQVYDAKLDNAGNLWLSQWSGREGIITKHEPL